MKRNLVWIVGAMFLAILAWWAGASGIGRHQNPLKEHKQVQSQASQTPRIQNRIKATPKTKPKSKAVSFKKDKVEFAYKGWKIDKTGKQPKVCIGFSSDLRSNSGLEFVDYINIEPNAKITAEITGNMACLSGLTYGKDYELTVLQGLKNKAGKTLAQSKMITVAFGDRPSYVAFAGNGVILPRIGASGIAIETVNVDKLNVEVLRVGDRIIGREDPNAGSTVPEGRYGNLDWSVSNSVREPIWKGSVDVKENINQLVTTVIPINELIGKLKPGAYIIVATRAHTNSEDTPAKAWRWIISTDIALTTYQGSSGLDVIARSIESAQPLANTKIDLIAVNNEILQTAKTDKTGHVHFAQAVIAGKGGMKPRMLMAYGKDGDYAMLDFRRSPLDLSAFDIGGRGKSKDIDAYVFTERGVYRPGETLNLTAMIRDRSGNVVPGRTGELLFLKPNGSEFRKVRFEDKSHGTVLQSFAVPSSAPRGVWSAIVNVDGLGKVGQAEFSVEDFVPEKLRVDVNVDEVPIRVGENRPILVDAQFLYGAPGSGLETEAEARLRIDPKPFPKYADYTFGDENESFREELLDLGSGITDGKGKTEFGLKIESGQIKTSHPLRAEIVVGVAEPGGRYIKQSKRIGVHLSDLYIGIKPMFDRRVQRGDPAIFKIRALDWKGEGQGLENAKWTLMKDEWHYTWFRRGGRWQYRREYTGFEIASGAIDFPKDKPAEISKTLDWGDYRLVVEDETSGAKTAHRFFVGWWGSESGDAPDQIQIAGPNTPVKAGDTIKLSLKSPYAGTGELVIADDKVRSVQTIDVAQGGSEISVKIDENITAGAYAMVSVYTPRDIQDRPLPRRAVGIGYIQLDTSAKTLQLAIDAPKRAYPRKSQLVSIAVDNIPTGEKAWLSLAAIDEGVLQVTKYKSPDPSAWYFDKRSLGIDVRDDYARLLNPNLGDPAIAKTGGDGLGGEGLTAVPIKIVSLYSGAARVKNGKAKVKLDLPDFNGEVRLMAVAWSETAVGSASMPMKVRDDVPAILTLPRFMAPGDRAFANLSLDNIDGKPGAYKTLLSTNEGLSIQKSENALTLKTAERKSVMVPIVASETGVSDVNLTVKGPSGYNVASNLQLQTRSPFRPLTKVLTGPIEPGETYTLSERYLDGLDIGTVDVTVSFSNTPGLNPASYAAALVQYPYGCTEQTVSRAMPLLYAQDIGGAPGLNPATTRFELQKAVDKIVNRQDGDGAFGLWYAGDGYARPWIGVYAADFLQRASEKELLVSDEALTKAYKALVTMTKMYSYPGLDYQWNNYRNNRTVRRTRQAESAAYAHYVLARAGRGNLSAMRYFYDNHAKKMKSSLSWGHLGAALAMMGDEARAQSAFEKALDVNGYNDRDDYYQTPLRDAAGLVALATEVNEKSVLDNLQKKFSDLLEPPDRMSTQEKAQTILALAAQLKGNDAVKVKSKTVKLTQKSGTSMGHLYGKDLRDNPKFTNTAKSRVWRSVLITGAPLKAPKAQENGYSIQKTIYNLTTRKPADLGKVRQGEKLLVVVNFAATKHRTSQAVLADLLPAGVEIETILTAKDVQGNNKEKGPFAWLERVHQFQITEARDDRLVAAVQTYRDDDFRIAYIVRATTQGDFIWPGAVVEDMYRPQYQSLTTARRVQIGAGPEG